jgi:hypothetical protein
MPRKSDKAPRKAEPGKPSPLVDTRVIYCGDNLAQLKKLPDGCIDLVYIDPPFNSNRNYEVFWGETREKRAFEDRHASTQAYIEFMRPRCVELARVLKKTGSFYYHCDWHASHYVKVMLDQIFGEDSFQNEVVWKRTSGLSGDTIPISLSWTATGIRLAGSRTPGMADLATGGMAQDYMLLDTTSNQKCGNGVAPDGATDSSPRLTNILHLCPNHMSQKEL